MGMSFEPVMMGIPGNEPVFGVVAGGPGMGKTSLCALWPDPFFVKTEDGTSAIAAIKKFNPEFKIENVASFGKVEEIDGEKVKKDIVFDNSADLFGAVQWLLTGSHKRKTAIFDSITRIEDIFSAEVLASETNPKCKTMNSAHGGFGQAWSMVRDLMRQFLTLCKRLQKERGMHVLFIAHEMFETVERPDVQSYMRSNIQLYPGTKNTPDLRALVIQECSLVAFIRQEVFVSSDRTKKQIEKSGNVGRAIEDTSSPRIISCQGEASNVGKNRWGIQEVLPFDLMSNPFEQYL